VTIEYSVRAHDDGKEGYVQSSTNELVFRAGGRKMINQFMFSRKLQELVAWVADSYPEVELAQKEGRAVPEEEYKKYVNESLLVIASAFAEMVERKKVEIEKMWDDNAQKSNC